MVLAKPSAPAVVRSNLQRPVSRSRAESCEEDVGQGRQAQGSFGGMSGRLREQMMTNPTDRPYHVNATTDEKLRTLFNDQRVRNARRPDEPTTFSAFAKADAGIPRGRLRSREELGRSHTGQSTNPVRATPRRVCGVALRTWRLGNWVFSFPQLLTTR
jgi:hypothetical protein